MVYNDVERFHLLGIIPKKKRYGTPKDIERCRNAILKNQEFIQFAIEDENAENLGEIMEGLVKWVIKCNEAYYWNMERVHKSGKEHGYGCEKKNLEITGRLLCPMAVGDSAYIFGTDGIRRTSRVLSMEKISPDEICFETLNTNYRLHLTGQEVTA